MKHIKITDVRDLPDCIETRIYSEQLDEKLKEETIEGRLHGGEHCFRTDYYWYRLNIGYTNPFNFGEVHAELELIKEHMRLSSNNPLLEVLKGKQQVFYGIGVGDTEIAFIDWAIKAGQKEVFVTGIDVNKDFIDNFMVALRNRLFEPDLPEIYFRGYHALFEQINQEDLSEGPSSVHICLGGTIGNFYDQDRTIKMFSALARKGENLILGVQLDKNIEWLYEKYINNSLYSDFILNYIPKEERESLRWSLNKRTGVIAASHKEVEVFRTKKYDSNKLKDLVSKHGFSLIHQSIDNHNNCCLQVYEKC